MLPRATGIWSVSVLILALVMLPSCREQLEVCQICGVAIPAHTRAVVRTTDGDELTVCDPRCPLTHQEQTGETLSLIHVTDFDSGLPLEPSRAVYLTGSDEAPDAHPEMMRVTAHDVAERHWHRCLPSVLSFATREAAYRFRARHGGELATLEVLGFTEIGR